MSGPPQRAGIEIALQIADNDAAASRPNAKTSSPRGGRADRGPHDGEAAKNIVEMAHEENIPVISYDRLILNADVDLYVTFDQFRIGQLMGEYMNEHLEKATSSSCPAIPGTTPACP